MKQIKFKQLATFGLCCSLLVNSLTGVTAVAETVTIESSPTVESSVKEKTTKASTEESAGASTKESAEESTQNSEVLKQETTTETTEEIKQTEEAKVISQKLIQPMIGTEDYYNAIRADLVSFAAGDSREDLSFTLPAGKIAFDITTSDTPTLNMADFNLSAELKVLVRPRANDNLVNITSREVLIEKAQDSLAIIMPEKTSVLPYAESFKSSIDYLDNIQLTVPKYVQSTNIVGDIVNQYVSSPATSSLLNGPYELIAAQAILSKINDSDFEIHTNFNESTTFYNEDTGTTVTIPVIFRWWLQRNGLNTMNSMYMPKQNPVITVVLKKVTENFKDINGTAIPAPTGFTQGKQTSITNNDYTFTQGGTLPEVYTASNGKAYKLKGWYKGKTKPATLETSKTPSYKVTYDDNDDLNVVYEETEAFEFPEKTFQFGFVNEAGQLVDPADFNITYDYKSIAYRGDTAGTDATVSFGTIATNQSATTVGNLKNVTLPATSITRPTEKGWNGDAYSNFSIKLPRYYQSPSLYDKTGKINPKYPVPISTGDYSDEETEAAMIRLLTLTQRTDQSYTPSETSISIDPSVRYPIFLRRMFYDADTFSGKAVYASFSGPVYYHLTNRRVTENFIDASGAKITPPADFTQGKQTVIDSDNFTYTSAKALPAIYTASNGKAYKLKGWYKGKTKPATLETSKTPSYEVTYDDNDDLNVVYEETKAFEFPALTYQFGFVDESGQRVDASTIGLTYDNWYGELLTDDFADWQTITLEKGQVAPTKNNLKEITYPAQALEIVEGKSSQYSAANLTFTLPKYYEKISVYNKNGTFDSAYPFPNIQVSSGSSIGSSASRNFELKEAGSQSFVFNQTTAAAPVDIQVPSYLREIVRNPDLLLTEATYYTLDKPVYYYLTNRKVTENFVDASGAKITAPTGFKQGKQTVIDSDNFTYTSAKALPASYTADGKSYVLQGWYKGTEKPATLETSKTPSYSVTYNDQDDLTVVYKEGTISADLTMRGAVDVIDNGAPMEYWEVLLKNTGEVPLTSIKIKPTTDWASGISAPTELFILGTGQNTKARPITKEQWEAGFEIPLDSSLPVGGQLTINLIGTKVTGQPGQVLKAAVEVTGNFGNLKASDTVRIKDLDQEIKEPTGEGFISVPTFDFGQVGVASATKQHGLKKAADYYGNGTRNPYVRISKTQPNWSLTAQLSQPKSATDSLPTATRLLLGAAPVSSFSNYNQPTELKNAIGTTNAIHLTANNAATSIIANQQFTGSDVYQLDFTFDNIKLEVPANQGTAGQQYQAAVTWNLVTGP
ncbi:WxL domain-containing protein [Enterococcus faecalis]|uniref:WxL domain-containing protein n=1 Tax=Enterococcus faecalis TaxID=1351 RepID=UPI0001B2E175|nr:WxL domain-containing protein [Enterococcus faecalis]EEU75670.1 conserved hypothetical protein [Enterococcus faecalis E1Sol]EIM5409089.1 WxL domain-containing protein [Enterococcus faecalis]EIW2081202.1 WxL domain-containing protein [Enterococcus faecalis]EJM6515336.1 WxL domain-containing protein [Enterococcus faecalis]EKZ0158447.1 WxL domain-containing protein [Enterococcus faecalis]